MLANPKSTHAVLLRKVTKEYRNDGSNCLALRGIELEIMRGDYVGITGKSGSGKTTLLNMITGIDRPTNGTVSLAGIPVNDMKESAMAALRCANVGIVFQFYQLLPGLTIEENILLPMDFARTMSRKEKKVRTEDLLERTGISDQAHKLPSMLSGGQQQRAAIARALANDPIIIVADEPTGNLDSGNAEAIYQIFDNLVSVGKTVILVSHDPGISTRVKRIVSLKDGLIVSDSAGGKLYA